MRRVVHRLFILLLACLVMGGVARAQDGAGRHVIRLKSGAFAPVANAGRWLDSMAATGAAKEPVQALVHFNSLPTDAQREALQQSGVTLHDYIPDNTFTAIIRFPVDKAALLLTPVNSIINVQPEWKADDYLWKKVANKKGAVEVLVSFDHSLDAAAIKQFIAGAGGRVEAGAMEPFGAYKVIIAAAHVRTLAQWYGVRYISPVSPIVPLDLQSRPAVKGNVSVTTPLYGGYGLMGDSVTVGVGDDCSGIYHADLRDRVTNFNPSPVGHHGEHVNGIVGGAANIDPLAGSMAPHVLLIDHLYDLILPATGALLNDYNMTITNNSYEVIAGDCGYAGTYDAYAEFVDTLERVFPEVQHVFASGNDGNSDCAPFPYGFATVGGGYQPAKNNIVVGSMTDYLSEAFDESRGPVKDGRLKPEIVAVGLGAYSTVGIDGYEWAAGTSMASPQVAGALAILTQRYKQLNSGAQPRADLLKAITLNGAFDIGNPGPDYTYGFGSLDVYRSLQMIDNGHYASNTISNGDSQLLNITIPPGTGQLKVMLYWNDVPASPSSAIQLVNDLDLTVTDPANATHLPLALDPTPANVNNNATEQADHLNNVEQVTINNPAAGVYAIKTKGYRIPKGPQAYVVAYDIIPEALHLTYPLGGEQLQNVNNIGDSLRVFWEAGTDGNTFTVQFSADGGTTWSTMSDSIAADARNCDFPPAFINSGKCMVRVIRNGTTEVGTSGKFSINTQPVVVLDNAQCPGYINIHWSPIPNATGYYLLSKTGFYMQVVDSVTDTVYSFRGMPLNATSYVAVQPIIDGAPGYRSVAAIVTANSGNCTNPVSTGDLMIDKVLAPTSGRMYTSTQFGTSTTVQVEVRDLYTTACSNYSLSYQVNGGAWQTITGTVTIPANGTAAAGIPGFVFDTVGRYDLTIVVNNTGLTDPQPGNDTLRCTLVNLPNDTMNLSTPFLDDFETMGVVSVSNDSMGVSPNAHWDYFNSNDSGRMRSFVSDDITISGNRSISLDENQNVPNGSSNTFVGTFNLSNYDTATTEIRVDFDYILHGWPKTAAGNFVIARGNDTSPWDSLYAYNLAAYPGFVTHVSSLSLTDALLAGKCNYSSSCQVSFGQNDTSLISAVNYGNGMTIDNFKLYTVANDAALVSVVSPLPNNCGLPSPAPLTVQVHNGVNNTLYNVQLYYNEDGGTTYTGIIDSIKGKATVNFTFAQQVSMAAGTTHTLNVWLVEAGDSYNANDSILNYDFRNSQIIGAYPYLENFEAGDGGYYSGGFKDSWQYGTPASPRIYKAASGTKAWKTNLTGNYNDLELSYLYSPCFDISTLIHPMLSFSEAEDIENCGSTLCDAAYLEYSTDGVAWTKLGAAGQGTNWYDSTFDVWNEEGFTRWHVASILLPSSGTGVNTHLRFVLSADPGVTFEGLAVDDIHIFDRNYEIFPASGTTTLTQDASAGQWTDYTQANQLLSTVQPDGQTISNTSVTLYAHDTLYNSGATQYTFPRSYTVKAPEQPADSANIRLYLLESDVVSVLKDTSCASCSRFPDSYTLGITQYDNGNNADAENGTLDDDTGGVFTYYPYQAVTWVPYDQGYYAQIYAKPFSEFWFNDGGPTHNFPAGIDYLNFIAYRSGANVNTYWYSLIDTAVGIYTLERSIDGTTFTNVTNVVSAHKNPGQYTYVDTENITSSTVLYYRLKWNMTGKDSVYYSAIRRVDFSDTLTNLINFSATMMNHQSVLASWTSYLDGMVNYYRLDRAFGDGAYTTIDNTAALRHYGQQYNFTDQPGRSIADGLPVHYRLTAVLEDSTSLVLPIRTVEWINNSAVVNVYPNPTNNGSFTILWDADTGTVMQLDITDQLGRSLYSTTVTAKQWNNSTIVETMRYPHAVYRVHINIGGMDFGYNVVYE